MPIRQNRSGGWVAASLVFVALAVPAWGDPPVSVQIPSLDPASAQNSGPVTVHVTVEKPLPPTATGYVATLRRTSATTDVVAGTVTDVAAQTDGTTKVTVTFDLAPAGPLGAAQPKAPGAYDVTLDWAPGGTVAATASCAHCFTVAASVEKPAVDRAWPDALPRAATAARVAVLGTGYSKGARLQLRAPGGTAAAPGLVVTPAGDTTFADVNARERVSATRIESDVVVCPASGGPSTCSAPADLGAYDVVVVGADGTASEACAKCFSVVPLTATGVSPAGKILNAGTHRLTVAVSPAPAKATVLLQHLGSPAVGGDTIVATNVRRVDSGHVAFTVDTTSAGPDAGGKPGWAVRVVGAGNQTGLCVDCVEVSGDAPTLTAMSPSHIGQGVNTVVTLTGTHIARGAALSVGRDGVTQGAVSIVHGVVTVPLTVDPDAATGSLDVTLTNTDGAKSVCQGCLSIGAPTALTWTRPPAKVAYGTSLTLTATLTTGTGEDAGALPQTDVTLLRRSGGSTAWTELGTAQTTDEGTVSWKVTVDRTATYRVSYAGDDNLAATAVEATVVLAGSVTLTSPRAGASVRTTQTFSGHVVPGTGVVRVVELRNGRLVVLATAKPAKNGTWSVACSLSRGRHTVYAELVGTASYAGARTSTITVTAQ